MALASSLSEENKEKVDSRLDHDISLSLSGSFATRATGVDMLAVVAEDGAPWVDGDAAAVAAAAAAAAAGDGDGAR